MIWSQLFGGSFWRFVLSHFLLESVLLLSCRSSSASLGIGSSISLSITGERLVLLCAVNFGALEVLESLNIWNKTYVNNAFLPVLINKNILLMFRHVQNIVPCYI